MSGRAASQSMSRWASLTSQSGLSRWISPVERPKRDIDGAYVLRQIRELIDPAGQLRQAGRPRLAQRIGHPARQGAIMDIHQQPILSTGVGARITRPAVAVVLPAGRQLLRGPILGPASATRWRIRATVAWPNNATASRKWRAIDTSSISDLLRMPGCVNGLLAPRSWQRQMHLAHGSIRYRRAP